ncbi:metal-dependent hydrolase [Halorubrum sp. SS5]|nr:metal-dependent hydrolase [Halorubrum sp. SS5]
MPDLLSHVLIGYIAGISLSWRVDWVGKEHVTLLLVGSILPDLSKATILVPDYRIESLLGIAFSWRVFHTTGGVLLIMLLIVIWVEENGRFRALGLLAGSGATHQIADSLIFTPSGYVGKSYLWPLSNYRYPTPGLYQSTDWWLVVTIASFTLGAYVINRRSRSKEQ